MADEPGINRTSRERLTIRRCSIGGQRWYPASTGVLYEYLEHRYADVTVLTFAQIEDLLGFGLPQLARTYDAWWTPGATNEEGTPHADAWTLAGRTATPNLQARTVTFERAYTAKPVGH